LTRTLGLFYLNLQIQHSGLEKTDGSTLFQVHDELTLEGPWESSDMGKAMLAERMSHALCAPSILAAANLDAKCAQNWYAGRGHGDSENHDRYPLGILGVIA
jgi:DNA polymerase I-like protein with 3'-5' exonuclease and polymerase domains